MSEHKVYRRFGVLERLEHLLLVLSFGTLGVTGLIQKFAEWGISDAIIRLLGGIESTRIIHRAAAIIIALETIYHLVVVGYKLYVRRAKPTMLPGIRDAREAVHALAHNVGIRKDTPKMGRYNFAEKAEYWAMIWGMIVMGLTDFIMWNPIASAKLMPGVIIPASKAAHGGEAILAVLAILLWHFYNVHIKNWSMAMIKGTLSRHEMEEEHARELDEIENTPVPEINPEVLRKRRKLYLPTAGVAAVVMLVGLYAITAREKSAIETVLPASEVEVVVVQTPTPIPAGGSTTEMDPVIGAMWARSGHSQADAPAFNYWNEQNPPEIPAACARCHADAGFKDYIGADGSAVFSVEQSVPTGTVINCTTCHNDQAQALTSVKFPSGVEMTGLGKEALCLNCHQGTASKVQVDEALATAGLTDDDTFAAPDKNPGFINIHYFGAAVARYGTVIKGGYEYEGQSYDQTFEHVPGMQTCTDCHNPHSLEVQVEACADCHTGVTNVKDIRSIRTPGSSSDYDGDGDVEEGLYAEIEGLRILLYQAIQAYGQDVIKIPIVYDTAAYPYFFVDTNEDGQSGADEAQFANRYINWTGRLEKAAYNYQVATKDPGAYVHGGKYIIQLLHDSIASLNEKLPTPVDISKALRLDAGHFAGSEEAFRHWDEEGEVPPECARCHAAGGVPQFVKEGQNTALKASGGFACETCHSDLATWARYPVSNMLFPSGASLDFEKKVDSNLCLLCHQGRESTASVDAALVGLDIDTVSDAIAFKNVHYFAAGATLFGTEAKGVYEYPGKTYLGRFKHVPAKEACADCHDAHALTIDQKACQGCHQTDDLHAIRMRSPDDYDGDGNITEGIAGEISTLQELLTGTIGIYAHDLLQHPVLYSPSAYPYFFNDLNDNGEADPEEMTAANKFVAWTPRLLKAAYNLHYTYKDPGAYTHNGKYILQVLYDSLEDLQPQIPILDLTGMTRP